MQKYWGCYSAMELYDMHLKKLSVIIFLFGKKMWSVEFCHLIYTDWYKKSVLTLESLCISCSMWEKKVLIKSLDYQLRKRNSFHKLTNKTKK